MLAVDVPIAQIQALLSTWAAKTPLVKRLWLFGSRVRGEQREDSDVDVAIELDMTAVKGIDESAGMATWAFDTMTWKPELELLLSMVVDLQHYKSGETNIIQAGLDRSSVLVYEKSQG
jgi:predicted nucleotidyltransferase